MNVTLFGNRVIADVISYEEVVLEWGGPQPNMTGALIKRGNLDRDIHTEKDHMKMKAEMAVMRLQAKE